MYLRLKERKSGLTKVTAICSFRFRRNLKKKMDISRAHYLDSMYVELWRACAGPLVHLPQVGESVFYFAQGHLEQVAALTNEKSNEKLPIYNLPSKILCKVVNIDLRAAETDEVYAQITLIPECSQDDLDKPDPILPEYPKPIVKSIYKVLTATDIRSKLHVRQKDANVCFPPLDMTQETPSQELVAIDLHGFSWHFKHKFTGNPRRHVLTTGWKRFVTKKRIVSGDSIIFIRGENGELRVGIRHVSSQGRLARNSYLAWGKTTDLLMVLATTRHAISTKSLFTVHYRPSLGSGPFIVGVNRYMECAKNLCSIGLKFSMRFEGEDHLPRRYTGSIIEVGDASNCWTDSKWRCLKVKWDDLATIIRPERVSPWEIDPVDLNKEQRHGRRNQAKKTRQPKPIHHSSAEENNMMNTTPNFRNEQNWCLESAVQPIQLPDHTQNWLFDPLISSEQYWSQNVGHPNWTSLQTNNIPTGPLLSNEDNWFQQMLDHMEQGSLANAMEPVQLDEIGCDQFPTVSPPIHFSELHGERVSTLNSEESVQGETRKRKTSSVGDAESGNGNAGRQVKCRIEPSQCGVDSNSNGTHYSSASEGEPCAGKFNQDLPPVEATENAIYRPFIYRAWDRLSSFLLHHLKNYVAK